MNSESLKTHLPKFARANLRLAKRAVIAFLVLRTASAFSAVTAVDAPDTAVPNRFYTGNRDPLVPSPFLKLPLRAITPKGWLRKQLELQASGFHGHLDEISRYVKQEGNAWLSQEGLGSHGSPVRL